MNNKKIIWIAASILILALASQMQKEGISPTQAVIPDLTKEGCFEKADCFAPIKQGYCNVRFDCIASRCYTQDVLCPEICDSGRDEDLDGKTDCSDSDCYSSPLCSCTIASFNACQSNACWCPENQESRWFVGPEGNGECICT